MVQQQQSRTSVITVSLVDCPTLGARGGGSPSHCPLRAGQPTGDGKGGVPAAAISWMPPSPAAPALTWPRSEAWAPPRALEDREVAPSHWRNHGPIMWRATASIGPTEGLSLAVKDTKRCGHGLKSFQRYRLRVLLHAGAVRWPSRPGPPRIRARSPHSEAGRPFTPLRESW